MKSQYDIVIHGAGIPGLVLALALTRLSSTGRPDILLLDRNELQTQPAVQNKPASVDDFDLRVFALTHASKQLLQSIGVWPGDASVRVYPYDSMHVWDAGGDGHIHFDAAEIGTSSLGYIVEGRVILDWLVSATLQESSIDIHAGDELVAMHETDSRLEVSLASGQVVQTRLLVGADGAQSRVRQLAGIATAGWSYHQHAVVAAVETGQSHDSTAWQRFLPEGPLAFLPLQKPWSSVVWSVSEQRAAELCELSETEFLDRLSADFQQRLGPVVAVGKRARFPLKLSHANRYIATRTALVADAAHTVHPLAGQGLNLGLLDVTKLADSVLHALASKQDIGSRRVLRSYERGRKTDNWIMQGAFDGLKRLFGNEQALLSMIRNNGLNIVDRLPVVKNALARKAMGV